MDTPSSSLQICTTRSSGSASIGFNRCSLVVRSGRATIKRIPALLMAVIRSAARNRSVFFATFHVLQRVAIPVVDTPSSYTTNLASTQGRGVDTDLSAGVKCSTKMNTGARATGLRGRLPCRRPDEPDLGNTSVGRNSVCVVMPLEIAPAAFFLLVTYQEGGTEKARPTTETNGAQSHTARGNGAATSQHNSRKVYV